MNTTTHTSILAQIAELESMSIEELRARWRELFATEPPGYSRTHFVRRLAFRIQELRFGGLSENTRATLRAIADREYPGGQVRPLARRKANDGAPCARHGVRQGMAR